MTEDTTKPTLDERYARAINSTDLRMVDNRQGSADLLAAFGISAGLGALLLRVQKEFDEVAQDVRRTASNDLTAAVLIFMRLKTLREAKNALGQHALLMATRRRHMLDDKTVLLLTGRVLAAWLDKNCPKCNGAKVIGGYNGKAQLRCRACGGSGNSYSELGKTDAERLFCAQLMNDMSDKSGHGVAVDVRLNKRAVRQGKEKISEALANAGS